MFISNIREYECKCLFLIFVHANANSKKNMRIFAFANANIRTITSSDKFPYEDSEIVSVCQYPEKRNHPMFVNISPTVVIDTSMKRS